MKKHGSTRRLQSGFTLVELITTIVIIGILTGIVTTTFVNAKERATNAAILASVNIWNKAFNLYLTDQGHLPWPNYGCLGNADSNFPVADGFANKECMNGYPLFAGYSITYPDSTLGADLRNVLGSTMTVPTGKTQIVDGMMFGTRIRARGIYYTNLQLIYYLYGKDSTCSIGAPAYTSWAADTLRMCVVYPGQ